MLHIDHVELNDVVQNLDRSNQTSPACFVDGTSFNGDFLKVHVVELLVQKAWKEKTILKLGMNEGQRAHVQMINVDKFKYKVGSEKVTLLEMQF